MVHVELLDKKYSWKDMSFYQFLQEGNIPKNWDVFFEREDIQKIIYSISQELDKVRETKIIYPTIQQVFRALYILPVDKIKAVIVGQDCYHNGNTEYDGSAVGLCFSVKPGNKINPSLRSIYTELKQEGFTPKEDGVLLHWAESGILLLNMALTVEKGSPGSHSCIWYDFSKLLIQYISQERGDSIHWLLFGKDAHKVTKLIEKGHFHCVSHPSPLSAYRSCGKIPAFIGSGIFSNVKNIDW